MIYMFCYDISHPKRLRKVAKALESFGLRVQKSFFQCEMEKSQMETLVQRILKEIDIKQDSFNVYPLCVDCTAKAIEEGTGTLIKLENFEIL